MREDGGPQLETLKPHPYASSMQILIRRVTGKIGPRFVGASHPSARAESGTSRAQTLATLHLPLRGHYCADKKKLAEEKKNKKTNKELNK